MNSMPPPSIPIRRRCFLRYLSQTQRLRSAVSASSLLATCPAQSEFHLVVAFIRVVPWHRISVAKLNLSLRRRRDVSITLHVISLKESRLPFSRRFCLPFK